MRYTEQRLAEVSDDHATVLVNHFPLRQEHAKLQRIPRFSTGRATSERRFGSD